MLFSKVLSRKLLKNNLTQSAREYFEKLAFKKSKKRNFKRLYLKSQVEFSVETNIFRKFIQFSSKCGYTVGRSAPYNPWVLLPAACRALRVKYFTIEQKKLPIWVKCIYFPRFIKGCTMFLEDQLYRIVEHLQKKPWNFQITSLRKLCRMGVLILRTPTIL